MAIIICSLILYAVLRQNHEDMGRLRQKTTYNLIQ